MPSRISKKDLIFSGLILLVLILTFIPLLKKRFPQFYSEGFAVARDEGGDCKKNSDCLAHLACNNKKCGKIPKGRSCASRSSACASPFFCVSGICDLKGQGNKCSSSNECKDSLACVTGVCADRINKGNKCEESRQCKKPFSCINGVCAEKLKKDAKCENDSQCETNKCRLRGSMRKCVE